MMEEALRQSMIISRGDPTIFFTRPISCGLLIFAAVALVIVLMPNMRQRREEIFEEKD
jgi:TctA family transporter